MFCHGIEEIFAFLSDMKENYKRTTLCPKITGPIKIFVIIGVNLNEIT